MFAAFDTQHTANAKSNGCMSVDSPRTAIHGGIPYKCNMKPIRIGLLRMLVAVAVAVAVAVGMVEGLCPIVNGKMLRACLCPYIMSGSLVFLYYNIPLGHASNRL